MSGPNDPKMREREAKLTGTVAMGMKMSRVSASCWKDSCHKEDMVRNEWRRLYDPEYVEKEAEIIKRVMDREKKRHEEALAVSGRELLSTHSNYQDPGKAAVPVGRKAYLKERLKLPPQERYPRQMTSSHDVGWGSLDVPPPRNPELPSYGHKKSCFVGK